MYLQPLLLQSTCDSDCPSLTIMILHTNLQKYILKYVVSSFVKINHKNAFRINNDETINNFMFVISSVGTYF